MADADLYALVEKLRDQSADSKTRRDAAKKLGQLKNPEAISFLAPAYLNDPDEKVRRAARDALMGYRRMEYAVRGQTAPGGAGSALVGLAVRLRGVLVVVLALTLVANAGLFLYKNVLNRPADPGTQSVATPRDDLLGAYNALIATIDEELAAVNLRTAFTEFQSEIDGLNQLPRCKTLEESKVRVPVVADIDVFTYPDVGRAGQELAEAAREYLSIRSAYRAFCEISELSALKTQLETQPGGSRTLVMRLDALMNETVARIRDLLRVAQESPLPTRGPSATPTEPPTVTPGPTSTVDQAAVQPTQAATAIAAEVTPGTAAPTTTPAPTETPAPTSTPVPTETPLPSPTPIPPFRYAGLNLDKVKAYQYNFNVSYSGISRVGETIRGSVAMGVTRQNAPLIARYDVNVRDRAGILSAENILPPGLLVDGINAFTIVDNGIFQTGDAVGGRCAAYNVTETRLVPFNTPGFDQRLVPLELDGGDINAVGLQLVSQQGGLLVYRVEKSITTADKVKQNYVIELSYFAESGVLARYTLKRTSEPPLGYTKTIVLSYTIEYLLIAVDDNVNTSIIAPEAACQGVQRK